MRPDAGEIRNAGGRGTSELLTRVKTGAVLTITVAIVLAFSHIPYVMNTAAASLSILGIYELLHAVKADTLPRMFVLSLFSIAVCFFDIPHYSVIVSIVWAIAVIVFFILMKRIGTYRITAFVEILPCSLMLPLFFRSFVEIRQAQYGLFSLLLVILDCLINDVAAYCVGKSIGKRKLAPIVSPGKTLEGAVGGLIASTVILIILSAVFSSCAGLTIKYGSLFLYLILASLVGQFGDLSMSVIKRSVGIKDFGKILPGHGGILDRFDSVLFVAPFAMLYSTVINGFLF